MNFARHQLSQPANEPVPSKALLEGPFPYAEISRLARADRNTVDPVYALHKWWARRPPAVIRALLLASILPADTPVERFWELFRSDEPVLDGVHVADPFMGGATSLVEAARLGARVTGTDVDPLAVDIARAELQTLDSQTLAAHGDRLLASLRAGLGPFYPAGPGGGEPLHYFWLRRACCPACHHRSLIYRNLILAADRGRAGAVVRNQRVVAFCPDCRQPQELAPSRRTIGCCGKRRRLDEATYARTRFVCPDCGTRSSNDTLRVGTLPRVLIAIEETFSGGHRRLRPPSGADEQALREAQATADKLPAAAVPSSSLADVDGGRPAAYGLKTVADLFSARQRLVLSHALKWVQDENMAPLLRRTLRLAVSNAISANNLLCGYATDYGRLSPLFAGVRAYAMPVLSVELNPLHASGGRGTLAATLKRAMRGQSERVTRHSYDPVADEIVKHDFVARRTTPSEIRCASADRRLPERLGSYDIVITDPPYYDFIPYSDLSLVHRTWLECYGGQTRLAAAPIHPVGDNAQATFARRLGRAFSQIRRSLSPSGLLAFTFHSSHEAAWSALGQALEHARLVVSAAFPVWADARAAGHSHDGNCEWDLVFVCRKQPNPVELASLADWEQALGHEQMGEADKRSMRLGLEMATKTNAVMMRSQ